MCSHHLVNCQVVIETHLFAINILNCFAERIDGGGHTVDCCIFFGDNACPVFINIHFSVVHRSMDDVAPAAVVEINGECVVTLAPVDTGDGAGLAVGVFGLFFFRPRCWDDGVGGRR